VGRWKGSPAALETAIRDEIARLSDHLPPYKRPSRLYLHPIRLPRTPAGELRRHLVRAWLNALERRSAPREVREQHEDRSAPTEVREQAPARGATFRREGDYWTIGYEEAVCRLRDTRGLQYIAHLLRHPDQEFHVLDLTAAVGAAPARSAVSQRDAGPVLDAQAKAAYRNRLVELREELAEAERFNDEGRAVRARAEIEALTEQLAGAVGLGGRDRVAAADAERARSAVTQGVKAALRKIGEGIPPLGDHLARRIKTGTFCVYTPDPSHPLAWAL